MFPTMFLKILLFELVLRHRRRQQRADGRVAAEASVSVHKGAVIASVDQAIAPVNNVELLKLILL